MKIRYFDSLNSNKKINNNIKKDINSIIKSGKFTSGKFVEKLELNYSKYYKVKYAIAVNSGSSALQLSLLSLNLKKNEKIGTTSSSFISTTASIISANHIPKFFDIDIDDFLMNFDKLTNSKNQIETYLPVSLYGKPINTLKLKNIIGKDKKIIVDASQSHGAKINNNFNDTIGDLNTFSFYPTKVLGGYGEGGMILTNNKKCFEYIKKTRNWGNSKNKIWENHSFNYRMDEIQASVISNKLKYLDQEIARRNKIAKIYNDFFIKKGVRIQKIEKNILSSYYIYPILIKNRDKIQKKLKEKGIETMIHYKYPIHKSLAYKNLKFSNVNLKFSEKLAKEQISLPIHSNIKINQIEYMIKILNKIL